MIAAAALGDVVEESGKVEHFGTREIAHQAAAQRKFVRELGNREAPEVADDSEDMLIDGVHVVKVVLHLPDDPAKRRNIAPQYAVLVHATKRTLDMGGAAQDLQKTLPVARIAPKCGIDPPACAP